MGRLIWALSPLPLHRKPVVFNGVLTQFILWDLHSNFTTCKASISMVAEESACLVRLLYVQSNEERGWGCVACLCLMKPDPN